MLYHSTRSGQPSVDSAQAVLLGLAQDGGLYMPQALPQVDVAACLEEDVYAMATRLLSAFLPDISDIYALIDILRYLGAKVTYEPGKFLTVDPRSVEGEGVGAYFPPNRPFSLPSRPVASLTSMLLRSILPLTPSMTWLI